METDSMHRQLVGSGAALGGDSAAMAQPESPLPEPAHQTPGVNLVLPEQVPYLNPIRPKQSQ